jgi:subtilisin family serine protease
MAKYLPSSSKREPVLSAEKEAGTHRFTGRDLVVLNDTAGSTAIERKAQSASLRMANLRDYKSATSPLTAVSKALAEADGVVFDQLKVAVVNAPHTEQVHRLTAARSGDRIFLGQERERYVYALAKRPVKKPLTSYLDDEHATWGIHAINVLKSKYTGKGVRMAILDTGIYAEHPDFEGRKIRAVSFVGKSTNDLDGHGTHCAGIAAGHVSQSHGFRYGVAPQAQLFVAKVLKNNGEGEDNFVLAGIEWALENKCKVISMSLGSAVKNGETYYESYETVARRALKSGTLLIAAAGNDSRRKRGVIKPVNHPANCPSILSVSAVDHQYQVADFSCGGSRKKGNQVNITAPGVDIISCTKKGYDVLSGTSMATPFVAGMAALLWEKYPNVTGDAIWKKLVAGARALDLRTSDAGAGIIFTP